ncbi:MAG TPA: DUF192 domain-containing protein [Candidatus Cryosericum sp.]|nr:DUF192 domain-containing protein [Candidatus Cryosericum sp.]
MAVGFVACLRGEPSPGAGSGGAGPTSGGAAPAATQGAKPAFDARRAEVRFPRGRVIAAEIADTPEKVARGYMYRTQVGERDGMIFVFPVSDVHPFWMKNTLVPLDMIWMDEEFGVLHIQPSAPPCRADPCPSYGPLRKAAYVLEVRGGTTAEEGLKVGDRLAIVLPGGEGGGS